MPRDLKSHEHKKMARVRRDKALNRIELREPTTPRVSAAGPTSMAIKAEDPATRRMIDEAVAKRARHG